MKTAAESSDHSPHWFWGSAKALQQSVHAFPAQIAQQNGGIAAFRILHKKFIAVSDPELYSRVLVKNADSYQRSYHFTNLQRVFGSGLFTTCGEGWQRRRIRANAIFNRELVSRMVPAGAIAVSRMLTEWGLYAESGADVSIVQEMQKLTVSIIYKSLFSVDISQHKTLQICHTIEASNCIIKKINTSLVSFPAWLPGKTNSELDKANTAISKLVLDAVAQKAVLTDSDILDGLVENRASRLALTTDILDECKNLFAAGYETTSLTLSWALYLLATHPKIANRWHQECDAVLRDKTAPGAEELKKLEFTRDILFETMRLYPVIYNQPRVCVADDILGTEKIAKGQVVILSVYGIHRNPQYWDKPDDFNPHRFSGNWPRKAFVPFGKGKHTCLGNNFSIQEMLLVLAMIGKKFELHPASDEKVHPDGQLVLVPDRPIVLKLSKRGQV